MAKHEFGIMKNNPIYEEQFDEYDSNKYNNCIWIDDNFIEPILMDLESIDCYWHTLKVAGKGIAYYGITLIPPQSMNKFKNILLLQDKIEYADLISLINKAEEENKYIIHFGI